MRNDITIFNDIHMAIPLLRNIIDGITLKIVLSTIDGAKTVFQICEENKSPVNSTYKKIRKLQRGDLISIEKIEIDENGKKVIFIGA